jgi:uncharacterized protein (TIGR02147 family)
MPNICEYTDFRKFLNDYYSEVKSKNRNFSYQIFSAKAGIRSKGFLFNVMQGKRKLSQSKCYDLAAAMKLNKHETEYFENLVAFNQTSGQRERDRLFGKLSSIKKSGKTAWKPQIVRQDQYQFYSEHHHSVIRSLIEMYGFKNDYKWLADNVYPRIKPLQAKRSVLLLERLGFIRKQKDGSYKVLDKSIATSPEVMSLAAVNFHRQSGRLALKALDELPKEKRNITGLTLGISKETYQEICEDIRSFRSKLLQKAEQDEKADAAYQLNFQFFPVSRTDFERKSK